MKMRITVSIGIFAVMALSNAIVPVLPVYAHGSTWQGAIYAAYFLGAFLSTLPGGIWSDRYGRVPVIRAGLALTLLSGILLSLYTGPVIVIILRCIEGLGAGFFVAAAMSYVNSLPDHEKMSGYFMAMLNVGLVLGLIAAGWLAVHLNLPVSGIILFTALTAITCGISLFIKESPLSRICSSTGIFTVLLKDYRWLWYSSIILVGITGVATSLYPKFSGGSPDIVGIWIAGMSVATIIAVIISSRIPLSPVATLRWSAVLMTVAVIITFLSPLGFILIGALAGVIMIAQMAFLSEVHDHQGLVMGLFSTSSYLGMTLLPVVAGFIADTAGFPAGFFFAAVCAVSVAITIGWCGCHVYHPAK
jgi:MFS family permease